MRALIALALVSVAVSVLVLSHSSGPKSDRDLEGQIDSRVKVLRNMHASDIRLLNERVELVEQRLNAIENR